MQPRTLSLVPLLMTLACFATGEEGESTTFTGADEVESSSESESTTDTTSESTTDTTSESTTDTTGETGECMVDLDCDDMNACTQDTCEAGTCSNVDSSADWGVSDPLSVPKTAKLMLDRGGEVDWFSSPEIWIELGLAISTQVFVTKTAGNLIIFVHSGNHTNLFQNLRRLRQSKKFT